jgi:hypothetical protein
MVIHSASVSQGGPFGSDGGDGKIWFTLIAPPEQNVLDRENIFTPPDTTINLSMDSEMASLFPLVGTPVNVTITVEGE